ncbi:iron ABC transporter permease [Lampropedia puyangensis]|uniref:Iron ABC transporter permease n=1 Tax=Lampropedia puyangensis TaxID=1330072 RepID=A0A4S8FC92_9BURK|nr:iron ABC transporter permease [Lampropedia puyangensis]THU05238.1 iron ABC transporter permease [Lampropedia puyangensis]
MPVLTSQVTARQHRPAYRLLVGLLLLCSGLVLLGIGVGSEGLEAVWTMREDPVTWQIVWDIRLPRTVGALLAGGLLGLAGCVAQGLFRNPLADPYLLGSSSGASLGVALALFMSGSSTAALSVIGYLGLTGAAFVGSVLAVVLTLTLAQGVSGGLRLLLAGVIVGVVLGACKDMIELLRPDIMQSMQSYTLGTTSAIGWQSCLIMAIALVLALVAAWSLSRVLDGLALGESTARSLGLPLGAMQAALIAVLALATAAAVAQTGLLAFIGLAAPHLVRANVKVRHNWLLLLSTLMGAVLLASADLLARWVVAPQELPVGVLTALLGGGYLLRLMHRQRRLGA